MAFKFPYGAMQQLNLDWFIKQFQKLRADWATAEENIAGSLQDEIDRAEDALSDVFTARDTAVAAKDDAVQAKADALQASANAAQYWQNAANSASSAAGSAGTALQAAEDAETAETNAAASNTQSGVNKFMAEAWAVGTINGTPVGSGTIQYNNNAKYYAQQASGDAAQTALDRAAVAQDKDDTDTIKDNANAAALRAEGWADGTQNGTPVASGSPYYENNAKYYKEAAEDVLESIPPDYTELADEVASQSEKIDTLLPFNSKTEESTITSESVLSFPYTGSLDLRYGTLLPSETSYKTTDYVDLTNVTGIYRTGTTTMFTLWGYSFYDEDKVFIGSVGSTTEYTIESYNGKQVTWLDLTQYPSAKYVRIYWDISRPYTYYAVTSVKKYMYDVPHILVNSIPVLKFYGKTIVNFGDSLFGNFRDTNDTTDKSISKMIADATGATVYNCGFGGCRMSIHSTYWNAFSMYSLADAIATQTWTKQDAAISAQPAGMPEYFSDTLALLKTIDFDEVDYITIGYGTNDYTGDIFVNGTEATFEHEYDYFKGALRYSLRTILNAYPHIRIAVITPCWRWFLSNGEYSYSSDDTQSVNTRGYYLYDYVDAIEDVCKEYHVAYIDTYYTLGLNQYTHLEYFPSNDGTHLNQAGRQLRTDRIVGKMESLY